MKLSLMKYVPNSVIGTVSRQTLIVQKHSPTILFVGGIVGIGATVVLACRATLKVEDVLDEAEKDRAEIGIMVTDGVQYNETNFKKDSAYIYFRTVTKIAKLYGPSFILGVTSIAALTGSHKILNSRNAGLTAAYAILERGFGDYRGRVVSELGEDKDREFRFGVEDVPGYELDKDGKIKKGVVVKAAKLPHGQSQYARVFDEFNPRYQPNPDNNAFFLRSQQNYFNQRLHAKRHVFLNDVYDALGFPDTPEGCVVGWVLGPDGDNYIDFGIFEDGGLRMRDFYNARAGALVLDFNVDGVVYESI